LRCRLRFVEERKVGIVQNLKHAKEIVWKTPA
jgi:hypothetical protein